MTIRLTEAAAREVYAALDVSVDNIELDWMNDEEEFQDLLDQVTAARDVMAAAIAICTEE